jgi:hypothetical protein
VIKEYTNSRQQAVTAIRYSYPASPEVKRWLGLAYISEQKQRHIKAIGSIVFRCGEYQRAEIEEGTYIFLGKDGYFGFASAVEFENSFKEASA